MSGTKASQGNAPRHIYASAEDSTLRSGRWRSTPPDYNRTLNAYSYFPRYTLTDGKEWSVIVAELQLALKQQKPDWPEAGAIRNALRYFGERE